MFNVDNLDGGGGGSAQDLYNILRRRRSQCSHIHIPTPKYPNIL